MKTDENQSSACELTCLHQRARNPEQGKPGKRRSAARQLVPCPRCVVSPRAWEATLPVHEMLDTANGVSSGGNWLALVPSCLNELDKLLPSPANSILRAKEKKFQSVIYEELAISLYRCSIRTHLQKRLTHWFPELDVAQLANLAFTSLSLVFKKLP